MAIRKPAVAGKFYTDDPAELRAEVESYMKAGARPDGRLVGILAPHAGYSFSGPAAGKAFSPLKNLDFDTLVVMATGHTSAVKGGALWCGGSFETPLGEVAVDEDLCAELLKEKKLFEVSQRAHMSEHAVEVQLPFLQALKGGDVEIVPLVFNSSDAALLEDAGRAIGRAMKGRRALFCVSSDLSHYPPGALAEKSDRSALLGLRQAMRSGRPGYFDMACGLLAEKTAGEMDTVACGQAPMIAGAAAALELGADDFELALYTHSGKVSGDNSAVVGYGAGFFTQAKAKPPIGCEFTPEMKKELLAIARRSIEQKLKTGKPPLYMPLSAWPEFNQPAAIFVTLTVRGELRGCIGSLEPRAMLADMAAGYACAAAFDDPRFDPVTADELSKISVEISVLSPLVRVPDAGHIKEDFHGVYVKSGRRSGTYLPQVWEHFRTKESFLDSLCEEKAGLPAGAWKEKSTELYVYSVDHFSEAD